MVILGINAYHADSSAAIFVDGVMVVATEEERFRRVKHWAGFPKLAIEFCLAQAGVTLNEVDHIAIGRDPKAKFLRKLLFLAKHPKGSLRVIMERFNNSKQVANIHEDLLTIDPLLVSPEGEKSLNPSLSPLKERVHQVEHHRSHIASAFFASPFEEAALLSIDGSGDFSTTMIGVGRGNQIEILDSIDFPHSIGIFYTAFTQLLGFPHYGDEYKVMGLAPYGKATEDILDKLRKVVRLTNDGLFKLDMDYFVSPTQGVISYGEDNIPVVASLFNEKMEAVFGRARRKEETLTQEHKDLAASVQRMTEETIFHILNHLQGRTGLQKICIAGGVAQNSVANGKITSRTGFKEVYIPSAGHDAGISMGAALYVQHQVLGMTRQPIWSAYTDRR